MDRALRIRLGANVVAQVMGTEMILLDSARGHYFDLNATGTGMLQQLLDGVSEAQITDCMSAQFGVDAQVISADLSALIKDLRAAGLIEIQADG